MAETGPPEEALDADRAAAEPPRRPSRLRRWARRALVALAALVLLAVGLYLTRAHTLHPLLVRAVAWAAPRWTPYTVEVGAIRGDWWSGLELDGLRVAAAQAGAPLVELSAERVAARFALPGLLLGRPEALEGLELAGARVELDLSARPSAPEQPRAPGEPPSFPRWRPDLAVDGLELVARTGAGERAELRGLTVSTRRAGDGPTYTLSATEARLAGRQLPLEGSVELQPGDARARGDPGAEGAGTVAFAVDLGLPFGRARTSGTATVRGVEGEVDLQGVALEPLLTLIEDVFGGNWAAGIAGVVNLSGTAALDFDAAADVRATVHLTGRDVAWSGRHAETLTLEGGVEAGVARVASLELVAADDSLVGRGLAVPFLEGLDGLLSGLAGTVEADVVDLVPWIQEEPPAGPPAEPLPPHRVVLAVRAGDGRLAVTGGRVESGRGVLAVTGGGLELVAPADGGGRALALDLAAQAFDLGAVGELIASEGWSGRLDGTLRVEGRLPALEGHAELEGSDVAVAGLRLGSVELLAHGDGERLELERLSADGEALDLVASGSFDLDTEELTGARLELDVERPEAFAAVLNPGGRLTASVHLDGPWRAPTGTARVEGTGIAAAGTPLDDLLLEAQAADGQVDVQRLAATTPYGTLDAALVVSLPAADRDLALAVSGLTLRQGAAGLALVEPAELELGEDAVEVRGLRLAGSAGALSADVSVRGETVHARVLAEDLEPTPFLAPLLAEGNAVEALQLELELERGPGTLAARARGAARVTLMPEVPPGELSWRGALSDGRAVLEELVVEAAGTRVVDLTASLPLDLTGPEPWADGPLTLSGRLAYPRERPVPLPALGEGAELDGELLVELDLAGTWRAVTGRVHLDARDLVTRPRELLAPWLTEPADLRGDLVLGETIAVEGLALDLPGRGSLTGGGQVDWSLDVPALLEGGVEALGAARLDLAAEAELPDLSWLAALPASGLRRASGRASATLTVAGTAAEPDVRGELFVRDGVVRPQGLSEIQALTADLTFAEGALEVRQFTGELGASPLAVSGRAEFGGSGPVLALKLTGENVLLARSSKVRVRGDLDLGLTGPLDGLSLAGKVTLRNSRLVTDVDFLGALQGRRSVTSAQRGIALPSITTPPLDRMRVDVRVETADPIGISSNVVRGNLRVVMRIGGTGAVLIPTGQVFIEDLRLLLPAGAMRFDQGLVLFSEADPFVPTLEMVGRARLAGYDVTLEVGGPLQQPEVEPASSPPLSEEEILLLVVTGRVPAVGGRTEAASQALGLYLAQDLLRRWASNPNVDSEESFLDRFELLTGREVSKAGVMTLEASYRMIDGIIGPRDALYIVAERDVYEDLNMGLRFVFRRK